ncbi:hypothetical protein N0V90_004174 [Kalmusia sp. IMI 367209]|nr:hypothetical protein N0V90_004174 [Kalmusia sp. IMI 367209]
MDNRETPNNGSVFFGLPAELRNSIYTYLATSINISPSYCKLYRVCKQFRDELDHIANGVLRDYCQDFENQLSAAQSLCPPLGFDHVRAYAQDDSVEALIKGPHAYLTMPVSRILSILIDDEVPTRPAEEYAMRHD